MVICYHDKLQHIDAVNFAIVLLSVHSELLQGFSSCPSQSILTLDLHFQFAAVTEPSGERCNLLM